MKSAEAKFNRIAQRRATNDGNLHPIAKSHFQKPATKILITTHGNNTPFAANPKLIEIARVRRC